MVAMTFFALSMSISPGPVNMLILSSGTHYGVWRSIPLVSGATVGFILLLMAVGFGLTPFLTTYPEVMSVMGLAGACFIIYVGVNIFRATPALNVTQGKVPGFAQGSLMQWLNPKAWMACAAGVALFASPDSITSLMTFIVIYFVICYLSLLCWAILGAQMSRLLTLPAHIKAFNQVLGGMLVLTAVYMMVVQVMAISDHLSIPGL